MKENEGNVRVSYYRLLVIINIIIRAVFELIHKHRQTEKMSFFLINVKRNQLK